MTTQATPAGGSDPAGPPALSPTDLFALARRGMLELADDYVRLGRVARPRRRGRRLAAEVEGTDDVYTCRADLWAADGRTRVEAWCACPSQRPFCKHVLALLLLWTRSPEEFAALDAWEDALAGRDSRVLAALLADVAMGASDALDGLRRAAEPPDFSTRPPGACLQQWEAFRAAAERAGSWPEAALQLGVRIAGQPGSAPADYGAAAALASRQLAWWLTLMVRPLPAPALLPWLRHLFMRLEAAAGAGDAAALAPELAVWLARLAASLPAARQSEAAWLARFCAAQPRLRPVCEAELQHLFWGAEVGLRLAVAPALPSAGGEGMPDRCRVLLAALQAEARGA